MVFTRRLSESDINFKSDICSVLGFHSAATTSAWDETLSGRRCWQKNSPQRIFVFKKRIFEVLAKNSLQRMDRFVVFADIVNKINRSNGKARVRVEACLLTIAFCFVCLRVFARLGLQIWNNRKLVPLVGPHFLREWRVTNFACCKLTIPNSLCNNSRLHIFHKFRLIY